MKAFARFVFDPATGELHRDGVPRRLRPQAQALLALLVSRPGQLVTREELRAAVARGAAYGAFDQSVNDAIREIRIALSDPAARPRYVETLPRRGYRFCASVQEQPPGGAAGGASSGPNAAVPLRPWAWIVAAIRSVFDPLTMAPARPPAPAWGREPRSSSEP